MIFGAQFNVPCIEARQSSKISALASSPPSPSPGLMLFKLPCVPSTSNYQAELEDH